MKTPSPGSRGNAAITIEVVTLGGADFVLVHAHTEAGDDQLSQVNDLLGHTLPDGVGNLTLPTHTAWRDSRHQSVLAEVECADGEAKQRTADT